MKFYVHKLGCPKNDVDADYISARLMQDGHLPVKSPETAETIIVNTCGFILPAREESINEMLRLAELKKGAHLKTIYAAGCLSQRHGDELLKEMPELDGAFGLGELDPLAQAVSGNAKKDKTIKIEARQLGYLNWNNRFIDNDFPYAYIKISDGCNRSCSYCSIPSIRGQFRSRPVDSIIREAEFLAKNGKKELILVSQEATMYGHNYQGDDRVNIIGLLDELNKIDGIDWIRLMYLHPAKLTEPLIDYIVSNDNKTLNYFDLPLQHINNDMLNKMNRTVTKEKIESLLNKIREKSSDSIIRTTFIVGFPGETDEIFEELRQFISQFEFDRMGVFTYSQEEETPAGEMIEQVPEDIKNERLDILMTSQLDIAFEKNNSLIGSTQSVIIDRVNNDEGAVGRTYADCPDVDQEIFVNGDNINPGTIYSVKIETAEAYDLTGTIINGSKK